jgi:hypothetical protein
VPFILDGFAPVSDDELLTTGDEAITALSEFSPDCQVAKRLMGAGG